MNQIENGSQMEDVPVMTRASAGPRVSRAKLAFLAAAGLSFLMSISLFFTGDHERGIYVGIWVPSILSAGALLMGGDGNERT